MNRKLILLTSVAIILSINSLTDLQAATCTWEGTKLTITGSGSETFTNCSDGSDHKQATEVTFGDGIISIGSEAFYETDKLTSVSMPYIYTIENCAFCDAANLTNVYMPNVKNIGMDAFNSTNLMSVDLPNAEYIGEAAFISTPITYAGLPDNANVHEWAFWGTSIFSCGNGGSCGICRDFIKRGTGCVKSCGGGYLGKEGRCISASNGCGKNYRQIGTWCNRIRYTPTEAAATAKNDNTNVVIITFRK